MKSLLDLLSDLEASKVNGLVLCFDDANTSSCEGKGRQGPVTHTRHPAEPRYFSPDQSDPLPYVLGSATIKRNLGERNNLCRPTSPPPLRFFENSEECIL